jgi:hypothetical protein
VLGPIYYYGSKSNESSRDMLMGSLEIKYVVVERSV